MDPTTEHTPTAGELESTKSSELESTKTPEHELIVEDAEFVPALLQDC